MTNTSPSSQYTQGIFWLASYPKSGNTWFRAFLANLLNPSNAPIDINQLNTGMIASAREWMELTLNFDTADFSHDELDMLRPAVYAWHSQTTKHVGYHKIHDAYTYLDNQEPLIPALGCLGALYFVRNPLDVAISFANHACCSIDTAISNMGNTRFAFCKGALRQHNQLRQWLLSWSHHVQSWTQNAPIALKVLRYEDMKQSPQETFTQAVQFLGLDASPEAIKAALSNASIEQLQHMEQVSGFNEKPQKVAQFFRKGIVGDWQTALTETQIQRVIDDHGETMQAFGYLNEYKEPILPGQAIRQANLKTSATAASSNHAGL